MDIPNTIRSIQHILGLQPEDGLAGPATWAAILGKLSGQSTTGPVSAVPNEGRVDDRSETNIATLHPKVQPYARALVKTAAQHGITIKVTSGTRTYNQQNDLYAQGRTAPGSIVTKARGGYSNHNFGIAFDVTMFDGTSPIYESPNYKAIGAFGKSLGLEWGGDWTSIDDEPHFQLRPDWAHNMSEGAMLDELRHRHDTGKDAFA